MSENPLIDIRLNAVEAAYPLVLAGVRQRLHQRNPTGLREDAVSAMRAAGFARTPVRGRGIYLYADRLIARALKEASHG